MDARCAAIFTFACIICSLVSSCAAVTRKESEGVQLRLEDSGSLRERFAALYEQIKPGLQKLSSSSGEDSRECAGAALERLLELEPGSIAVDSVQRMANVKVDIVERFTFDAVEADEEGMMPSVLVYRESDWELFMRDIGALQSPKASFGTCSVKNKQGESAELLVLGMLVSKEQHGFAATASLCMANLAKMAFPGCSVREEQSFGTSEHSTALFREPEDGVLCGVVKLFLGEKAEHHFQSVLVLENSFQSLRLDYSLFCSSVLSTASDAFRMSHPECSEVRAIAYEAAKGQAMSLLRDLRDDEKRLSFLECARYIGRALGELHREGTVLLSKPEFVNVNPNLRLQTHTVKHTVNGLIDKFYAVSDGNFEFDIVGVASLLYELEQCVKRHPGLHQLLTAVHGDTNVFNVFTDTQKALFRDPTGVFDDVLYTRPSGKVTFIDYGEGGAGVGIGEAYYALTLMQMHDPPDGVTLADTLTAFWQAYHEENPVQVANIVRRYYRYMAVLAFAWRIQMIDIHRILPEFTYLPKYAAECEDHEQILQLVIDSFTLTETPVELEQRFDAALGQLFSSHFIRSDIEALQIIFRKDFVLESE